MKLWAIIMVVIVVALTSYADEKWKDINDIADVLEASESQLPDIKIKYTFTYYGSDNGKDMFKVMDFGTYACKKPEGLIMIDKAQNKFDTTGNSNVISDLCASFNGKTTYYLNRKKRTHGIMMANIEPGYTQTLIDEIDNPDWSIWRIGRTHISDLLKKYSAKIQTVTEENFQDIKTVKLQCDINDNSTGFTLWISPEKDFLPIKYQLFEKESGRIFLERTLHDIFQLDNGRWYPRKIITGEGKYALCMTVDEIDTNTIPSEFFTLEFPPNTHVTDHIVGITYMINPTIPGFGIDNDILLSSEKDYPKNAEKVLDSYLKNDVCSPKETTETHESHEYQIAYDDSDAKNTEKAEEKHINNKYFYIVAVPLLCVAISIIIFTIKKNITKRKYQNE